jgi:ribosomal protein S18 acetylase RimI-like enzyme
MGIASVATAPSHRRQGWARLLVRAVMELLRCHEGGPVRFLLFSEVDPKTYAACGFRDLPESDQHFKPSIAMATGDLPLREDERRFLTRYF